MCRKFCRAFLHLAAYLYTPLKQHVWCMCGLIETLIESTIFMIYKHRVYNCFVNLFRVSFQWHEKITLVKFFNFPALPSPFPQFRPTSSLQLCQVINPSSLRLFFFLVSLVYFQRHLPRPQNFERGTHPSPGGTGVHPPPSRH